MWDPKTLNIDRTHPALKAAPRPVDARPTVSKRKPGASRFCPACGKLSERMIWRFGKARSVFLGWMCCRPFGYIAGPYAPEVLAVVGARPDWTHAAYRAWRQAVRALRPKKYPPKTAKALRRGRKAWQKVSPNAASTLGAAVRLRKADQK
jgi:hypothetical protein